MALDRAAVMSKLAAWGQREGRLALEVAPVADELKLNPTLVWINLDATSGALIQAPTPDGRMGPPVIVVAMWRDPLSQSVQVKMLSQAEVLALRLALRSVSPEALADGGMRFEDLGDAVRGAVKQGLLIPSRRMLRRDLSVLARDAPKSPDLVYANSFCLQWHLTYACELHCKHCYVDRRGGRRLTLERGERILDMLEAFCRERYVRGMVSFTGGNPMLSPVFFDLYASAVRRGFSITILGNATTRKNIQRLVAIRRPEMYQVSLEGLEEHNDSIRGKGYFQKVLKFLQVLREAEVSSAVMLTLTRDNLEQVLPLADRLKGRADIFTFNRICPTGHGADLQQPAKPDYDRFLQAYVQASRTSPMLSYKDNLINIVLDREGRPLFSGCTGHGCGAAFNFVAIMPDGEVHACRKFDSPIGSLMDQSLGELYDSPAAAAYRRGMAACDGCRLRLMCGGCMGVTGRDAGPGTIPTPPC